MEIAKTIVQIGLNITGFLIIYYIIDYKRKKSIFSNIKDFLYVFAVVLIAGILIAIKIK